MAGIQGKALARNPRLWITAAVAASVAAVSYKLYDSWVSNDEKKTLQDNTIAKSDKLKDRKNYTKKSVALTLTHSVLSSKLPLADIILNSENVTFILPPSLSLEDLEAIVDKDESGEALISSSLMQNYKVLKSNNIQGYYSLIKSLRPDTLLVCADDMGIDDHLPKEMNRFIKQIVTVEQNSDQIFDQVTSILIR